MNRRSFASRCFVGFCVSAAAIVTKVDVNGEESSKPKSVVMIAGNASHLRFVFAFTPFQDQIL